MRPEICWLAKLSAILTNVSARSLSQRIERSVASRHQLITAYGTVKNFATHDLASEGLREIDAYMLAGYVVVMSRLAFCTGLRCRHHASPVVPPPPPVAPTLPPAPPVGNEMLKLLLKVIPALTFLIALSLLDPTAYGGEKTYLVLGVIASGNGSNGVALLKSQASGATFAVKVGHKIEPGVEVAGIAREYVTFSVRGRLERIRVGEESGADAIPVPVVNVDQISEGIETKGDKVRISSSLRDTLTGQQLSRVLVQAAALPYYEDGQLSGFKLMAIDAGSIYDKVGFKDGDIVTSVNGQRLSDVGRTIQLLHSLKGANMAQVTYKRGGADRSLTLEVQ